MPLYDPKNDTDNVCYGFLKKVLGDKLYENTKNTSISYSKNFGSTPTVPYTKGDTWNRGDNIYICINSRDVGNFKEEDWQVLYDKETNEIISNSFQFLSSIDLIKTDDGYIETFYQSDDPSTNWNNTTKPNHVGDYYMNSTTFKTYKYSITYEWEEVSVTTIIFNNITGHRRIFTSRPSTYDEGDIWKINNTNDVDLFTNIALNDFLQARVSNNIFTETDWELISNELNIKANLYSPGGKMVSANNVFSNLQYSSFGKHGGYDVLGFDEYLGLGDTSGEVAVIGGLYRGYADIAVDIDLPDNFKVVSAFLSVYHTPIYWSYATGETSINAWGASKNIKLYKMADEKNLKLLYQNSLTYRWKINNSNLTEIPNAFGATSFSFNNTQNVTIQRKDTINLKNHINATGKTKLVVRTGDSIPSSANTMVSNTGMARAVVNILGYVDLKGSGS